MRKNFTSVSTVKANIFKTAKALCSFVVLMCILCLQASAQNFTVNSTGDTHATTPAASSGGMDAGGILLCVQQLKRLMQ